MDTHVPDNTIVPPLSSRRPQVVLPGEEEAELCNAPTSPSPTDTPTAAPRQSRRGVLLGGAAITAVVLAAAGVFLLSPYNTVLPVGVQDAVSTVRQGAENTVRHAAQAIGLVAPAAQLATTPTPEPVPAPVREVPQRSTREAQLDEILTYRQRQPVEPTPLAPRLRDTPRGSQVPSSPGPAVPTAAPKASVPPAATAAPQLSPPVPARSEHVATPQAEASAHQVAAAVVPDVSPPAPTPATSTPLVVLPVPVPVPAAPAATAPDPVAVAATLRPAPMSTQQQVEVLGLVTQMAVIQRNREERDRQMQADLAAMREQLETSTADFSRRLALAEARGAMNAAMGAAATPPPAQASAPPPATVVAARTPGPASPAANDAARRRYRVQAASPGLAMLSEVDRTGESGSQLQVAVGDDVPGYGKITAIAQQGSNWMVRAERGTIQ